MRLTVAVILMASVLGATPVESQQFTSQTPKDFDKYCTGCHSGANVDIDKDAAWWNETVEKMSMKYYAHFGAHVATNTKTEIARFLAARSLFNATCSKCHGVNRPLEMDRDRDGWIGTVARMSVTHETKFGIKISKPDQDAIVNYLTVVSRHSVGM